MLGDPVTKPKEYGDIMGYYSRQTCGQMLRTVFTRLRNQARHPAGGAAAAAPATVWKWALGGDGPSCTNVAP